jgi:acyl carrier protein phosphodiesterase
MNYLAHAYLSFNDPQVLAGNMISDYVKGKTQYDFEPGVQVGIKLHRAIDEFTDSHQTTKKIMNLFRPQYRLYAGAFTDVVYDYFLANDKENFLNEEALKEFSVSTYTMLQEYFDVFPEKFKKMFPYMVAQNWLYHYRLDEGIEKSFNGLVRRAAYLHESDIAFEIFLNNKTFIEEQYRVFFVSVKNFAACKMQELLKN